MTAVRMLAALTILGFVGRIVLSWYSYGSDDALYWWHYAGLLRNGPFKPYEMDSYLNHPPLPLLWSGVAIVTAWVVRLKYAIVFMGGPHDHALFGGAIGIDLHDHFPHTFLFAFIFRLAPIAADIGSSTLLYRIWTRRGGDTRWGWLAAAAFAWNLDAIMDGAYHCNTDNICAFMTLLAAYQLAERRNFFAAGLAMAGAINVKIVPVVLIPVFFSLCRDWHSFWQFVKGMSIGVIPFAIFICVIPVTFIHNVFGYTPMGGEWGLTLIASYSQYIPLVHKPAVAFTEMYHAYGKYPMLAMAAALGVLAWRVRRWDAYELGALAWCVFLIFTPGWGFQYTIYVAPLMMAARLGRGTLYGLVAGLYLLSVYSGAWTGTLPLMSIYDALPHYNPLPVPMGFLAWGILVVFFAVTLSGGFSRKPVALV